MEITINFSKTVETGCDVFPPPERKYTWSEATRAREKTVPVAPVRSSRNGTRAGVKSGSRSLNYNQGRLRRRQCEPRSPSNNDSENITPRIGRRAWAVRIRTATNGGAPENDNRTVEVSLDNCSVTDAVGQRACTGCPARPD